MKGYPSDNGAKKHRRLDASPPPAHAMPPHQGVQRSTTSPRQGDHPVHGDDHLADADTTPLCQPLRHSREITPRKNGGATTSPTATPCLYATLSTMAGRSPWARMAVTTSSLMVTPRVYANLSAAAGTCPVKQEKSWRDCMGFLMAQAVKGKRRHCHLCSWASSI